MAFTEIYERNTWGFGSGHGSLPALTKPYRKFLEGFIQKNAVRAILDFGCGDWQFSQFIDWNGADYLGLDIVPSVIESNRQAFRRPRVQFEIAPESYADLPYADLLLVKDVLQHWETAQIRKFLETALPKFKFALITNDTALARSAVAAISNALRLIPNTNCEIKTGGYRPLDLRRPPFGFPATCVLQFKVPGRFSWRTFSYYLGAEKTVLLLKSEDVKS